MGSLIFYLVPTTYLSYLHFVRVCYIFNECFPQPMPLQAHQSLTPLCKMKIYVRYSTVDEDGHVPPPPYNAVHDTRQTKSTVGQVGFIER